MKTLKKTYGLTLVFLCAGLVWLFLGVDVPPINRRNSHPFVVDKLQHDNVVNRRSSHHFVVDRLQKDKLVKVNVENTSDQLRFYSVSSKSGLQDTQHRSLPAPTVTPSRVSPLPTPPPDGASPRSNTHIVAVVSYMRSGSTLTADILQHFPATTYVFEPLHMISLRILRQKPLFYLNGTIRRFTPADVTDSFITEEVHKWFECRYDELDVHSLADNFHRAYSRSMKKLARCWQPKRHTLKSMRECLPEVVDMCLKAKHRLFKFIRLPMQVVERIFNLYPNLQIIHLLRDPRGSLVSQIKVKKYTWEQVPILAKQHCHRAVTDLNLTVHLHKSYPDRIKVLLYENFAMEPLGVAKRVYQFSRLPAVASHLRYISKLTQEGRRDSTNFGIIRGNSSETAFSWRDSINYTDVNVIDGHCRTLYKILGYRPLEYPSEVADHSIDTLNTPNSPIFI